MKTAITILMASAFASGMLCAQAPAPAPAPAAAPAKKKSSGMPEAFHELAIGDVAPPFSLPGIDDKKHTLEDYKDAQILVIAFMSNHCPDSQAAEGRLKKLVEETKDKGVALVAVNPNNPVGLRPDELGYSKYNDSFDEMKLHAKEQGFNFPYLYDGETQAMAMAYGCLATPHIFIFDGKRKLAYKGQLDDSRYADDATVKTHDARNAIDELLAGKPVTVAETRVHGCSTKWLTKKSAVAVDDEKWAKATVDVELIDADGVAALRKNGTKKVRLFNVWATWCAPCVAEFPELAKTARKFGLRDFEMITISMDRPQMKDQAKAFLEKYQAAMPDKIKASLKAEGRTTNSYLYTGPSPDALVNALDPEWPGPLPHTVLVAPDGSVIWRHNGEIDGEELRAEILKYMGRYYKPE
ncbi:MAG: redoxin domain-containing protein [Roseimicrobium sp.]